MEKTQITRRTLIRGAALGAATIAGGGALAGCVSAAKTTAGDSKTESNASTDTNSTDSKAGTYILAPTEAIDYKTASNLNVVPKSTTVLGTTEENLMTALTGETGATTKYEAFALAAKSAGFSQIARLFQATSDAEKIHIKMEFEELLKINKDAKKPEPPEVETFTTDINLILGANGEIYETSDMYPSFVKVALNEDNEGAAFVFARAKLAESVHAKLYMESYNNIDSPDNDVYYLCPVCGYIHKGENFTACPICMTAKSSFTAY
jgi:rubrerythrin